MYAICGVGNWGLKLLSEFSKTQKFKYFCCNSSETETKILSLYPHLKRASLEEICHDSSITDVIVSVPINKLGEFSKKLIAYDKNLFLEKPASSSLKESLSINRLNSNNFIQVNYKFLFHEKLLNLKKQISSGRQFNRFSFEWFKYGSFNNDIRLNLLCHPISILKYLFPLEDFYMEYSDLQENSVVVNCFSDKLRGRILICRKSQDRRFHFALEDSKRKITKVDLNNSSLLNDSIKNFVDKTNSDIGLEFASKVLKQLENIK